MKACHNNIMIEKLGVPTKTIRMFLLTFNKFCSHFFYILHKYYFNDVSLVYRKYFKYPKMVNGSTSFYFKFVQNKYI